MSGGAEEALARLVRQAFHAWVREDAGMAMKLSLTATQTDAAVEKITRAVAAGWRPPAPPQGDAERLTEDEKLRAAISWIEPPFIDESTPVEELRQRIAFVVADAKRAALAQARPAPADEGAGETTSGRGGYA